ncbi:MAG TPA: hypothetical protein VMQ62_02695 [Dongiaceae bacterium]|nr:hypothetical protein [Dongiaceae bacterium]
MTRMSARLAALAATMFLAAPAVAGEVYGKITFNNASVGADASVAAKCGSKVYPGGKTDKGGGYHLALAESGKCSLTVAFKGQAATLEIASYDDPAQVDIVLEMKEGMLAARRR